MSRLDLLLQEARRPTLRTGAWTIMALLAVFAGWSSFAQLDEVAVATGEVIPQAQLKVIQHLEGGIVTALEVQEGDLVEEGDVVVRLDLGSQRRTPEDIEIELDGFILARARLKAEISGDALEFPAEVAERRPELVAAERATYMARQAELRSTQGVVLEQIRQRELEVEELRARQNAIERNLELARQRLGMSSDLLKSGLTPRMEHLEMRREMEDLTGQSKVLEQAVPRSESALAEARARLTEEGEKFRRRSVEEQSRVETQIARLRQESEQAANQELRTAVKSPIAGTVKNLRFNTIGGVVRPGEPIMEIVPRGNNLVIEAHLNPVDRGYVQAGQEAVVKISTYDFVRYGGLDGVVTRISPGTNTDPNTGVPFYTVVVTTEKTYLGQQDGELPITPGMQAIVDIHTGTRSVINYLVTPVFKLKNEAFRER